MNDPFYSALAATFILIQISSDLSYIVFYESENLPPPKKVKLRVDQGT